MRRHSELAKNTHTRLNRRRISKLTLGNVLAGGDIARIRFAAALWAGMGTVCATIWSGGSGPGDIVLLHLRILSAHF